MLRLDRGARLLCADGGRIGPGGHLGKSPINPADAGAEATQTVLNLSVIGPREVARAVGAWNAPSPSGPLWNLVPRQHTANAGAGPLPIFAWLCSIESLRDFLFGGTTAVQPKHGLVHPDWYLDRSPRPRGVAILRHLSCVLRISSRPRAPASSRTGAIGSGLLRYSVSHRIARV